MNTIKRISVQQGYDLWSVTYDETPNPVVAMDQRHTIRLLAPQKGERILDAGCGTGRNSAALLAAKAQPVGIDFSEGMLAVARQKLPTVTLQRADLQQPLPFEEADFDAVLCALIGEHLKELRFVYREFWRVLKPGGRLVFSVYHPQLAVAGKEANFTQGAVNYRLGAELHTIEDYAAWLAETGFTQASLHEFVCDEVLVKAVPPAQKYLGQPILLVLRACKP